MGPSAFCAPLHPLSLCGRVPLRAAVPTGGALESTPAAPAHWRPGVGLGAPAARAATAAGKASLPPGPNAVQPRQETAGNAISGGGGGGGRPPAICPHSPPVHGPHFQPVLQKSFPLLWLSGSNQNPALGRVWRVMDVYRQLWGTHLIGKHRPSPLCFSYDWH